MFEFRFSASLETSELEPWEGMLRRPGQGGDVADGRDRHQALDSRCEQWVGFERTQQSSFRLLGALDHFAGELQQRPQRGVDLRVRGQNLVEISLLMVLL